MGVQAPAIAAVCLWCTTANHSHRGALFPAGECVRRVTLTVHYMLLWFIMQGRRAWIYAADYDKRQLKPCKTVDCPRYFR